MNMQVKIELINEHSHYLQDVIKLGDANKKTLGFLADTAFMDHARRKIN
jgi:hypothetical protein